jgi:hypothetical protein
MKCNHTRKTPEERRYFRGVFDPSMVVEEIEIEGIPNDDVTICGLILKHDNDALVGFVNIFVMYAEIKPIDRAEVEM